jgi:methyltransferase, FkbM family
VILKFINKVLSGTGYVLRKKESSKKKPLPSAEAKRETPVTVHSEELEFIHTTTGDYFLPKHAAQDKIANFIRKNRIYSEDVIAVATQYIKPGTTVIDAGANFGQLTVLMSKLVGTDGIVFSFEANEFVYGILSKNIEANKASAKPFFNAVHNVSGETLYFPMPDFVRYSTYGSYGIDYVGKKGNPVTSIALDDLDYPLPVSFMKIDVQGGDLLAMQGATKIIEKYRMPILFEYEFEFEEELNLSFQDCVDFVRDIDYTFAKVTAGRNYLILPKEMYSR